MAPVITVEHLCKSYGAVPATPLPYAVRAFQDGWLGLDPGLGWTILLALAAFSTAGALAVFRWE